MGEVWRAKDTKLGREVAIKTLPEEFARDSDRLARFEREAKLLASLNHPNIAAIYGVDEHDGSRFLVLELVEGETVADRLQRGAIPAEESLKLALQIAEALEAAHEKGVIHRDLKPANIKVTDDDQVKVLDFGLAKALAPDEPEANPSNSPTLSMQATQQGVMLGTAAYMSPEQAKGRAVDKRADVWAFGCVLYEMLSGRQSFGASDVTESLAAVIRSEPEWGLLPGNLHPRLSELVERCLEKNVNSRFRDIGDVKVDIQKVLADPNPVPAPSAVMPGPPGIAAPALGFLLGALVIASVGWLLLPEPAADPTTVFHVDLPAGLGEADTIAISPNGRDLVYSINGQLYVHSFDEANPRPIPGTEGGLNPFFSPDGQTVGFFTPTELKTIPLDGGEASVIADVPAGEHGSWSTDNEIFFGRDSVNAIYRVPATGGTPEAWADLDENSYVSFPLALPESEWVVFIGQTQDGLYQLVAQSRDTLEQKTVSPDLGGSVAYLSTGHLVHADGNRRLSAVAFDPVRAEVLGDPVVLIDNLAVDYSWGIGMFSVSENGTLVYASRDAKRELRLSWLDRNGDQTLLDVPARPYVYPRISPDGTRASLEIQTGATSDLFVLDLQTLRFQNLTADPDVQNYAEWTSSGDRIIFSTNGYRTLSSIAADGSEDRSVLYESDHLIYPQSVSPDGRFLVFKETRPPLSDIWTLSLEDLNAEPLFVDPWSERNPIVSPNGEWVAYQSDESGEWEINLSPFPDVDAGTQPVSIDGGRSPLWSPDGSELFFIDEDRIMVASVDDSGAAGVPEVLLEDVVTPARGREGRRYDITSDGERFLMVTLEPAPLPRINVIMNWTEELKERVPVP